MSNKAMVLMRLYERGKITKEGLQKAVTDGVITEEEYRTIVGE